MMRSGVNDADRINCSCCSHGKLYADTPCWKAPPIVADGSQVGRCGVLSGPVGADPGLNDMPACGAGMLRLATGPRHAMVLRVLGMEQSLY